MEGKPVYLHIGHLIDRAEYLYFKEWVLHGIKFNPEAEVADHMYWQEDIYKADIHMKAM